VRLFRRLEHEGKLEGGLAGRRRTYRIPSNGGPRLEVPVLVREPVAPPATGGNRQLATLVVVVVFLAALVTLVLAPDQDGPSHQFDQAPAPTAPR
jgi:hypothetical protein